MTSLQVHMSVLAVGSRLDKQQPMASSSGLVVVLLLIAVGVLAADAAKGSRKRSRSKPLRFYMHDMVDISRNPSKDATAILVASPSSNLTQFGSLLVIDDALTATSSPSSKLLGRARGTYITDSLSGPSLFITFTAVLENGTICFHGQDDVMKPVREIAVVGGTGAYRYATGYAEMRTSKLVPPFSAILKVKVFLKDS